MGDDWVEVNPADLADEDEDEFEYLAPPDIDPDYLDEQDGEEEVRWKSFNTIHEPAQSFESNDRRCFLPGQPIKVHIKEVEHSPHGKLLNPYLYFIELKHGDYEWTVVKRYKHFSNLHEQLQLFRAKVRMAVPTRTNRERRKSFARRPQTLPKFPRKPDALLRPDDLETRRAQMEAYLQNVLRSSQFRNHCEMLKFLEVSHLSFVLGLGPKLKEGTVKKRSGGQTAQGKCCGCFYLMAKNVTAHWDTRWLILKDTFVALVRPTDGMVRDVMLMDGEFEALSGTTNTGMHHGLRISNLTRHLTMKCWTGQNALHWKKSIMETAQEAGKDFTEDNRMDSFAPVRHDSYAAWFVDGSMYMSCVADAMERAKEEIFITDWWLSPEIYMKRPMTEGEKWRLDMILKRKAEAGVKIFVVIFKEMEMALGINSFYTKQALLKLHPTNIKVMRHPDGINFWSHHEKCVVIDQRIAFLGGIDLCYGRWDTPEHRLTDLGSVATSPGAMGNSQFFNSLDINQTSTPVSVSAENTVEKKLQAIKDRTLHHAESLLRPSSWPATVSDLFKHNKHHKYIEPTPVYVEGGVEFVDTPSPSPQKCPVFPERTLNAIPEQSPSTLQDLDELDYSTVQAESYPEHSEKKPENAAESIVKGWGALAGVRPATLQNDEKSTMHDRAASSFKRTRSEVKEYTSSETVTSSTRLLTTTKVTTHEQNKKWSLENVQVTDNGEVELFIKNPDLADKEESKGPVSTLNFSYGSLDRNSDSETEYSDAHSTLSGMSEDDERRDQFIDLGHANPLMGHSQPGSRSDLGSPMTETETISTLGSMPTSPIHSGFSINGMPCGDDADEAQKGDEGALSKLSSRINPDSGSSSRSGKAGLLQALSQLQNRPPVSTDQSSDTESAHATTPRGSNDETDPLSMQIVYNPAQEVIAMTPRGVDANILAGIANIAMQNKAKSEEPVERDDPEVEAEKLKQALKMWTQAVKGTTSPKKDEPDGAKEEGDKSKRPNRLRLRLRQLSRQQATDEEGNKNGEMVLNASRLNSPDTPEFQQPWPPEKPSTPPARKRFAKKALEIKSDLRQRFNKRKSQSMDVSLEDSGSGEPGPTMYRAFNDAVVTEPTDMLEELGLEGSKIWIGKDYINFIFKDAVDLDKPFTDFIDRTQTPRMPWHDIGAVVYGKAARDVARHFIQRWNFTKLEKRKTNLDYPMLLPKTYSKVTVPRRVLMSSLPCDCQILRSSSTWSAGIQYTERSIQNGYIDTILNAKHYIYIENQFFVSIDNHISLHNEIASALYQRITKAHSYGETFRVYVIMPLLPAFEGELGTGTGTSIQAITHWNYSSICRGGKSLIERLVAHGVQDPTEYVTFYGLRTHGDLLGVLHSELVYVHSKIMIVDDQKVIIGSANINDRSMCGDRDSELAVLVEDTQTMPSRMNGEPYQAGWFASSLRKTLFREHLGVRTQSVEVDVSDPVISTFYKNVWIRTAAINTSVYDRVFRCVPTDHVRSFSQLHEYQKREPMAKTDPGNARQLLEKVCGHLVFMPLMFLVDESLQPTVGTKEALVPTAIWT